MILLGLALQVMNLPAPTGPSFVEPIPIEQPAVIPSGMPVRLVTLAPISSRTVRQGQRLALLVDEDVTVGSAILIPRGTAAVGEVETVTGTGMFGKAGRLVLKPLFIDLRGTRVNLEGASSNKGEGAMAEAAITTVLLGGLGLMITGKSSNVPAGTVLFGRVRLDTSLPVAAIPERPPTPAE